MENHEKPWKTIQMIVVVSDFRFNNIWHIFALKSDVLVATGGLKVLDNTSKKSLGIFLTYPFFSTGTNANAAKGPSYMIWDLKDAALVQHHPTKAEFDFDCLIPANFRSIVPEMMLQSVGGIWYCSVYPFFLCFGQRYSESRYLVLCPACRARRSTSGSTARST